MNRRISLVLAVSSLLGLGIAVTPALAADGSVTITESNERYAFGPSTVYVNVGDVVTWTNDSDAPHTVTSDSGSELASANFGEGETFDHAFSATGTFAYHCTIHDYMTGRVVVLAEGVAAPATDRAPTATSRTTLGGAWLALVALLGVAAGALAVRRVRRPN